MDEFRRSAIRRLFLQSEYADKATTFLNRNRTRQMHEISRHEILSQCPYVHTPTLPSFVSNHTHTHTHRYITPSNTSLLNLLEDIGCAVQGYNEFHLLCEASGIYEFVTRDFADSLAKYIRTSSHENILEVGAGGGLISRALKSRLSSSSSKRYIATDASTQNGDVLKMDYRRALSTFRPSLVVVSWMPRNEDWTNAFRECSSVSEYLIIGDPTLCGTSDSWSSSSFRSRTLEEISSLQLCRYDRFYDDASSTTRTNSRSLRSRSITRSFIRRDSNNTSY